MAFSQRQVLQPSVLDLNVVVAEFERMLRRLVGEQIRWLSIARPLYGRWGRPRRNRPAIMNLALNARDAMPDGGMLTIATANVTLTKTDAGEPDLAPGR